MVAIDKYDERILNEENATKFLSAEELKEYLAYTSDERERQFRDILDKPIKRFTCINELYFRQKWANLVKFWCKENAVNFMEIASGDADMIPQALNRCDTKVKYISANMNAALNRSLIEKTKDLDIGFCLIDDDAANISKYISDNTVDIIGFQHGVNDVLQAILCGQNGIDTVMGDWMELLPKMIAILQEEIKNNTFEEHVKEPFMNLIHTLSKTLKPDGLIAIHHYMFQLDLDMGYPSDLFEYLIPMVRKWFQEESKYRDIQIEGFAQEWWLFLQK